MSRADISIYITLGYDAHLGLDDNNNLIATRMKQGVVIDQTNLGPLTPKRAKEIGKYLEQLAIHTKDD